MRRQGPLRPALAGALTAIVMAIGAGAAQADPPPPGSSWHEAYITEPDGTKLHADVLRPEGLKDGDKTPVILSVGPYFNHSGQTGPAGPAEDTPFDPTAPAGPSGRFFDFVNGAHLMQRGYTYVMVDLRGFGGSSGCLDWAGPGEQADVKAAVEWAAKQPWSTGKVGMYGKSYDGVTGLIGTAVKPAGLAAVVSQEPVYDLYRYLYANRVRYVNSLATPALYDMIAETPGSVQDSPDYNSNGANDLQRPGCPALNYADQQDRDHDSAYWRQRDLIAKAKGSTVPLFMTQGFLENNTKPDGASEFFNDMAGPKRAWFGMWDHVRGNDVDDNGRLKMGRAGWFGEGSRHRGGDQRRQLARRGCLAAEGCSDRGRRAAPGHLHGRRHEQRHRRGRLAERQGPLDDQPAAGRRRAPGRRAQGDRRGRRAGPGREPGRGRLRHRPGPQRHVDQPRHLAAAELRHRGLRDVRRRLEAARRPPRGRAADQLQLRVVGPRAHRPEGHREVRGDLAALPLVRARRDHPGRPLGEARVLQERRALPARRPDGLARRAERLYESKRAGRNRVTASARHLRASDPPALA
jgi:hypothetical protein